MTEIVEIKSKAGSAKVIVEDPSEYIQAWWLAKREFFEVRLLEYIYWHYKGGVFVDVGSNLGNHTLFLAKFCEAHVVSVEPQEDVIAFQKRVLELNKVSRTTLHKCAISNYTGRGSIVPWEARPTFRWSGGQLREGDDVHVTTLDDVLFNVNGVKLVKIDVEMKEREVLEGAVETLTKKRPALFIEIRSKGSYNWVKNYLREFGYRQVGSHFQEGQVFEFTVHADETEISSLA